MFLRQYQRERKCFLSERELKKALRDTLTRAAWLGPSKFWLVRSEHAHASYPGLFFRPPGFSPYMGREERRVQGLDYSHPHTHLFQAKIPPLALASHPPPPAPPPKKKIVNKKKKIKIRSCIPV